MTVGLGCAGRAILGPVEAGAERLAAEDAPFHFVAEQQGRFQLLVQRQHGDPEPLTQQGVGNALNADTFLPVVQRDAVAVVIVAALMYQLPRFAVLRISHDGKLVIDVICLLSRWTEKCPSIYPYILGPKEGPFFQKFTEN